MKRLGKAVFILSLLLFLGSGMLWFLSWRFQSSIRYIGPQLQTIDSDLNIEVPAGPSWIAFLRMRHGQVYVSISWDTNAHDGANLGVDTEPPLPPAFTLWDRHPFRQVVTYIPTDLRSAVDRHGIRLPLVFFRHFYYTKLPGPTTSIRVYFPGIYFPIFFGIASLYFGVVWFRSPPNRRKRRGLCVVCGYDLTGNVCGVCSECGTPITGDRNHATH